MFKPMFALHKDRSGNVLGASSFKRNYEFAEWIKSIDARPGDVIEFGAATERPEFDEIEPAPAFIAEHPAPPALADEEQTF
jgi:hypothetical protein